MKDLPYSWAGRINTVIVTILPKGIYSHQNYKAVLHQKKKNLEFHIEILKTQGSQSNSEQKE